MAARSVKKRRAGGAACPCCVPAAGGEAAACYCPVDGVISVLGRKFALPIIGLIGNHPSIRFNAIEEHLPALNPRTLTDRLRELEEAGLLRRESFREMPRRVEYSLTREGREVWELVKPLMAWADRRDGGRRGR